MKKQISLFTKIGALVEVEPVRKAKKSTLYALSINGIKIIEVRAKKVED